MSCFFLLSLIVPFKLNLRGFILKNNRSGQAEILNDAELDRIARNLKSREHKLFFAIARYTGERFGAICQLKTGDVYDEFGNALKEINFRANTRKASPDGKKQSRQVPIIDRFRDALVAYHPKSCDRDAWLFPSPIKDGQSITWSAADKWFRAATAAAGMEHRGISGHSLRRSFITKLYDAGIDLHAIQQITGHKSLAVLQKYIGTNPRKIRDALSGAFS